VSKTGSIPAHEPRSHKGLLHAEPPAQGGILAPGGPSSGEMDPHPDAKRPSSGKSRTAAGKTKPKRARGKLRKRAKPSSESAT